MRTLRAFCIATLLLLPCTANASSLQAYVEKFPLSELRILLITEIDCGGTRIAYVMGPDGYFHIVVPGEYIGDRSGKIREITADSIVVDELQPDGAGGWREVRVVMDCAECRERGSSPIACREHPPAQSRDD